MPDQPFELGPIRPVDEADSLLIRTTRGCPWNRCEFCTLYKGFKFSLRSVDEIKQDIRAARDYYNGHPFTTCFLQDGDSFVMKTRDLVEILQCLKQAFPSLRRISSYGRAQTMVKKSGAAIKEIHDAGLNKLYCGLESGSETVLRQMKKGITQESVIKSGRMAKAAGMEMTHFIILGLGGRALSTEHARETAHVLNRVNPDQVRVLTLGVKAGSRLERQVAEGRFSPATEVEMIQEQRLLVSLLNNVTFHYANHHGVDLLLEIRGRFPRDKEKILAIMDRFLGLPPDQQTHFILGRRLGYYQRMDDMADPDRFRVVETQATLIREKGIERFEEIFHRLRTRIV